MRQLIWKEWHEQAWKLILGCIVVSAFAAIGLRTRIIEDQEMVAWVCLPFATLLPLFAATGLIPTERSEGSFETLRGLPIALGKVMAVEAIVGVLLSVIPLAGAMVASVAIAGGREMTTSAMSEMYGRSMLTSAVMFAWLFAATIRLPSEARAAMVAIGVLLCWIMLSAALEGADMPWLATVSPFSFLLNLMRNQRYAHSLPLPRPSLFVNGVVEVGIGAALWMLARRAIGRDVGKGE